MKKVASNLLETNYRSTFLSCGKDQELIWRKLLVESKPYSDKLKRLLIINTPDCLDRTQAQYQDKINTYTIKKMSNILKPFQNYLLVNMKKLNLMLC